MFPRFYRFVPFSFSSTRYPDSLFRSIETLFFVDALSPSSLILSVRQARCTACVHLNAWARTTRVSSGSEVGYRVREKKKMKRGDRGGWAWFVFEVESTLHLLSLRRNHFAEAEDTSRNSVLFEKKYSSFPPFSCRTGSSTPTFVNLRVNRCREFCPVYDPRHGTLIRRGS